jgi:hypothetical protein
MKEARLMVASCPDPSAQVIFDHDRILERVAARDGLGAREPMAEHLEHTKAFQCLSAEDRQRCCNGLSWEGSQRRSRSGNREMAPT